MSIFITWLHALYGNAEIVSISTFLVCFFGILFSLRVFGLLGLYTFNVVMVIAANIQVLKVAAFQWSPEPVALGTIPFAMTFLVSDMVTEYYGKEAAIRGVWLSFWAQILMTALMLLTIAIAPCSEDKAHDAMMCLFMPSPRLLLASFIAFFLSQRFDILLFQWMKTKTEGRWLWARQNISMSLSALLDNAIFSTLAWIVLSPTPVTWSTLLWTYILGTYIARVVVSVLSTPMMYAGQRLVCRQELEQVKSFRH